MTVIKAFYAMYATYLRPNPRHREGRQVVFYAGDDNAACADFDQLIGGLGFAPVRVGDYATEASSCSSEARSTHCACSSQTHRLLPRNKEVECDR